MDFNRFTQKVQDAFHQAQNSAVRYGHAQLDLEHLLLSLSADAEGTLASVLGKMDVSLQSLH